MKSIFFLITVVIICSCSTTKKSNDTSNSYANILEMGEKLYAFRMPVDSVSNCFFKEYNDIQLINHYINYDIINNTDTLKPISRIVTKRNTMGVLKVGLENQENTQIVTKISIDKLGRMIAAELLEETTAVLNQTQKRKILAEVLEYQYQAREDAPCIESGKLTIILTKISTVKKDWRY